MKFMHKIAGGINEFEVEDRILNITIFLMGVVLTIGTVGNILLQFPLLYNIILSAFSLSLFFLYYLARTQRPLKHTRAIVISIAFIVAPFAWRYNQGTTGTSLFYFYTFVLLVVISMRKHKFVISAAFVLFVIGLIVIEAHFPDFVIPYNSETTEFYDFTVSFVMNSFVFIIATIAIQESYQREKQKDKKRNRIIIKQRDHLAQLNKELAENHTLVKEQKESLENLNNINNKLFSIVSHDLRSPLANLETTLQVLNFSEPKPDPEESKMLFCKLQRDLQNTSALLDNLLHWSKKQRQGIEFTPVEFSIKTLIQESVNIMQSRAKEKEIEVVANIPQGMFVLADLESIRLVLRNLLSNAIKFSYPKSTIWFEAKAKQNFIEVAIRDQGMGIAADKQAHIFKSINYTKKGTNNEKGSGLGLFLCQEFVRKNNGEIWFETTEGKGTTFFFKLPTIAM